MIPRVSATLIVRDELKFIEDCLRSLAGRVDEIIIVDTGSCDDTMSIARRFPVELHTFRWDDDFSAARNFAISQATGDWILYIDADERLGSHSSDEFSRVLTQPGKVAWHLRFHPRVGWTPYAELRLFRNDPRIRFQGIIHERIHTGVEAVGRSSGAAIGTCQLGLFHVGYEGDQSHKNARNVSLLRGYLSREPERIYCWWHLGECLRIAGDENAAIEAWSEGVALIRVAAPRRLHPGDGALHLSLIKLQKERGAPVDDLVDEALELFPSHLGVQWVAAQFAVERGDDRKALPILEKLTSIDADAFFDPDVSYDKALFQHRSAEVLALCHFRAGRFSDAAHWYRIAARTAPEPHACEIKARLADGRAFVR